MPTEQSGGIRNPDNEEVTEKMWIKMERFLDTRVRKN